ncbi:44816_t:CDS:2, partial [Gigaspora margarita]
PKEKNETLDTSYIFKRPNNSIPSQNCILKYKLDNLPNEYLKALDEFIPESQKGQKGEVKIKNIRVKEVACKNLVKTDKTENKLPEIELKNKIEVDNDITKSAKESDINRIGIESQALLYYQKFVEATKTNHM